MAEETPVSPISAAEPPAVNPLAGGAAAPHAATLKLNPVLRKPAGAGGLKPGLKLPPKPGIAAPGGLKPGLKLPPRPGLPTQGGLKPGLKLPPKPVIRKPGATVAAAALPKPVNKVDMAGVSKLPTVSATPVSRENAAVADLPAADAPTAIEALKSVTQKLKGVTQPIPAQAVLKKTGIVAALPDGQTPEQHQAAKAKTSRISLSDAMGVAPVMNEAAPMKTIRIKRPTDLPGTSKTLAPVAKPALPTATPAPSATPTAAAAPAGDSTTVTQRKTLKIVRPGAGVRPGGKFAVKRPTAATTVAAPKAEGAAPAAPAAAPAGEVADIPDIPSMPQAPVPTAAAPANDVPTFVAVLGILVQTAACVAMGALMWFLIQDSQLPLYCGGCL